MPESTLSPFALQVRDACLAILDNRLRRKAKCVELGAPDAILEYEDFRLAEVNALLDTLGKLEQGDNQKTPRRWG